jgi:protocatechuate 3,4-dioxygenase alpha subunit
MKYGLTPTQTIGPFFHDALAREDWSDLTAAGPKGEMLRIEGRVVDGDGAPLNDALIEIWQADAEGIYPHGADGQGGTADPNFAGFGRCATDEEGVYRFTTIRPGRVAWTEGRLQAAHIGVSVFARGLLNRLVTRIYFGDDPATADDPVLAGIQDPAARRTLLAQRVEGSQPAAYRFDIVLQGDGETAFFDL